MGLQTTSLKKLAVVLSIAIAVYGQAEAEAAASSPAPGQRSNLRSLKHNCVHDKIQHKSRSGFLPYDNHPFFLKSEARKAEGDPERKRKLAATAASSQYRPIRITPILVTDKDTDTTKVSPDFLAYLQSSVLQSAIDRWQTALSVVPVAGNMRFERDCDSYYVAEELVCHELSEQQLCQEVLIPESMLSDTRVCESGCAGPNCALSTCKTVPGGSGVPNSDFVVLVTAKSTSSCASGTLAYATACRRDQWDRPVLGMINFCPQAADSLTDLTPYVMRSHSDVAFHELGHALGFSAGNYAFMRDADGNPRTPRDSYGYPELVDGYTCTSGININQMMAPSSNTLQFVTENNHRVAKLTTPRVTEEFRAHTGCASAIGANLEDQDPACFGSHWEERLLQTESMSPMQSHNDGLSRLTLAYFEDSGWYKVNYAIAEPVAWGRNMGCDFISSTCMLPPASNFPQPRFPNHFCTRNVSKPVSMVNLLGCTIDYTSKGMCEIIDMNRLPQPMKIPTYDQYFTSASVGSTRYFADFCPVYEGTEDLDCRLSYNQVDTASNYKAEVFCPNCRCLQSSLAKQSVASSTGSVGCYKTECSPDHSSVTVTAKLGDLTSTFVCTSAGQQITMSGFSGSITCPNPASVCADRVCPSDCSLHGRCVSGACVCDRGFTGADCATPICPNGCSLRGQCNETTATCTCYPCWQSNDCSKPSSSCPMQSVTSAFGSTNIQTISSTTSGPTVITGSAGAGTIKSAAGISSFDQTKTQRITLMAFAIGLMAGRIHSQL